MYGKDFVRVNKLPEVGLLVSRLLEISGKPFNNCPLYFFSPNVYRARKEVRRRR
jgi:hypothetical protein